MTEPKRLATPQDMAELRSSTSATRVRFAEQLAARKEAARAEIKVKIAELNRRIAAETQEDDANRVVFEQARRALETARITLEMSTSSLNFSYWELSELEKGLEEIGVIVERDFMATIERNRRRTQEQLNRMNAEMNDGKPRKVKTAKELEAEVQASADEAAARIDAIVAGKKRGFFKRAPKPPKVVLAPATASAQPATIVEQTYTVGGALKTFAIRWLLAAPLAIGVGGMAVANYGFAIPPSQLIESVQATLNGAPAAFSSQVSAYEDDIRQICEQTRGVKDKDVAAWDKIACDHPELVMAIIQLESGGNPQFSEQREGVSVEGLVPMPTKPDPSNPDRINAETTASKIGMTDYRASDPKANLTVALWSINYLAAQLRSEDKDGRYNQQADVPPDQWCVKEGVAEQKGFFALVFDIANKWRQGDDDCATHAGKVVLLFQRAQEA